MDECMIDGCGHEGKIDGLCAKHHALKDKALGKTVRSDDEPSCSKCGKKASEVKVFIKHKGLCKSCAYYKKKKPADKEEIKKQKLTIEKQPPQDLKVAASGIGLSVKSLVSDFKGVEDIINHPPHYTKGKIEVIDFISDQEMGYLDGNIIKYVSRYRHKGSPIEDLKKAKWYLERLIENVDGSFK